MNLEAICSLQIFKLGYKPSKATDSITTHLRLAAI
uniref:DAPF n=1 Tax=Arundo donax TaxID=35708 RepID=A0A0A9GM34_ARUDO